MSLGIRCDKLVALLYGRPVRTCRDWVGVFLNSEPAFPTDVEAAQEVATDKKSLVSSSSHESSELNCTID